MSRRQTPRKRSQRSIAQVFAIPLAIALTTIAGLVLGLTGDGWRDGAAWLLAGIAPFSIIAAVLRRTPKI